MKALNQAIPIIIKPLLTFLIVSLSIILALVFLSPSSLFSELSISTNSSGHLCNVHCLYVERASSMRVVEWRPCKWWIDEKPVALSVKTNGHIRVDCYGGLNQMRRDFSDDVGIARLLNATLVLPKFEIVKELPPEMSSVSPFQVDCRKRKGQFDYIESVLPLLLEHQYISITPAMSQRRDRYPLYAKATRCQACYKALRLNDALEKKAAQLLEAIPKPFLALHLRF
ncbi:O-fucosyltransferase 13-like protein [Drosera capensis]